MRTIIVVLMLLINSIANAELSNASLNQLMEISGINDQVNEFPDLVKSGMINAKREQASLTEAQHQAILRAVDKSIIPAEILEEIKSAVKPALGNNEVEQLLSWYQSDIGKKITKAEQDSSTAEAYAQMTQQAQQLLTNQDQVAFAKRLDQLIGATDFAMHLQEYVYISVYSAMKAVQNPNTPFDIGPLKTQMEANRNQNRAMLEQFTIISFLYSYKAIEQPKLDKYEQFLSTPASKKFHKAVIAGMSRGMETGVSNFTSYLASILN